MSQVSSVLRRGVGQYMHWCPACEEMHPLPDTWNFNGDLEKPTFTPSFKHSGIKRENINGKWTGNWIRDAKGNTIPFICHYNLVDGILQFCKDCTHSFANKNVPLPKLPERLTDED